MPVFDETPSTTSTFVLTTAATQHYHQALEVQWLSGIGFDLLQKFHSVIDAAWASSDTIDLVTNTIEVTWTWTTILIVQSGYPTIGRILTLGNLPAGIPSEIVLKR